MANVVSATVDLGRLPDCRSRREARPLDAITGGADRTRSTHCLRRRIARSLPGVELSPRTREHVLAVFAPRDRPQAEALLASECARNLPFCEDATAKSLERIRFAAIKVSEGNLEKLRDVVRLAQVDWRDLLMAAGFGESTGAHLKWQPESHAG